jgi:hypothetical protein
MREENFARQFLAEIRQTVTTENIDYEVLHWVAGKVGAARAELIVCKARGIKPPKSALDNSDAWQYALDRVSSIAGYVRQISGISEQSQATVENMSMPEYAAARKDLGMKDPVNYERTF